jgi:hypothetical protein
MVEDAATTVGLMQLYFFDLNFLDDGYVSDIEGSDFPDLNAAKREARLIILELAADYIREQRVFDLCSVRIGNERREPIADVKVADVLTNFLPAHVLKFPASDC